MALVCQLRLFLRWFCSTWCGTKAVPLFLVTATVMYTLFSDIVIAHVDIVTQQQTRAMLYTNKDLNAKINEHPSASSLPTNITLPDNTALLQRTATDASASPLVRDLASLQLSLDAYVDGIEFRLQPDGEKSVVRFASKPKDHVSSGQKELQVEESAWDSCVTKDSVLVSGTSFTREIYFSMLRRLKREALSPEDKMIPSYNTKLDFDGNCTKAGHPFKGTQSDGRQWCIYGGKGTKGCNLPGPAGLFIKKCGMPKSQVRRFSDVNMTISFRFKTYLYTPVVDETILHAIRSEYNGLVVLGKGYSNASWEQKVNKGLGGGEWGRTPQKHFRHLSAPELAPIEHLDQARRFVGLVLEAMASGSPQKPPVLVIYCNKGFNRSCKAFCQAGLEAQRAFLDGQVDIPILVIHITRFEKQYSRLRRKDRTRVPRLGHGHSGGAVDALTSSILSAYCRYRSPK